VFQKGDVARLDQAAKSSFESSVRVCTGAPATGDFSDAQLAQLVRVVTLKKKYSCVGNNMRCVLRIM